MSTPPTSLRNIPSQVMKLAQELSVQTGLSINDVFRLALASGVLIEVSKVSPRADGTFCGLSALSLAKALRPHLGSVIDLLVEQGELPYQSLMKGHAQGQTLHPLEQMAAWREAREDEKHIQSSLGEDLDTLGIGLSLSQASEGLA
jgi:hypothetical protein